MYCTVLWYKTEKGVRDCNSQEDFDKYTQLTLDIKTGNKILEEFGCLPRTEHPDCQAKHWKRTRSFDTKSESFKKLRSIYNFNSEKNVSNYLRIQLF